MIKIEIKKLLKAATVLLLLLLVLIPLYLINPRFTVLYSFTKLFSLIAIVVVYKWLELNNKKYVQKLKPLGTILFAISINFISLSIFMFDVKKNYVFNFQLSDFVFGFIESVIFAAVIEEFLYRRVLLGELLKVSKSKLLSIIIVSFIFTAAHLLYILPVLKLYALIHVFVFSL